MMVELQVKKICKEQGITLQDLADRLGINRVNLSVSINGNPTLVKMTQIANALGVSVNELLPASSEGDVRGYLEVNNRIIKVSDVEDLRRIVEEIDLARSQKIDTVSKKKYLIKDCVIFCNEKDEFAGFANATEDFPIEINGIKTHSVTTLFEAMKFPRYVDVDVQAIALNSSDPGKLKEQLESYDKIPYLRPDWDEVKVDIMEWCVRVKFAQHFYTLRTLLEKSKRKPIVEQTVDDPFWGACSVKQTPPAVLGINVLGQIWMKIRNDYFTNPKDLFEVKPLKIKNFTLYGRPIEAINWNGKI